MGFTIAVSGKGGTGKTTLSALMIKSLIARGKKPVLAVDADANSNLNEVLGVAVTGTVGGIREDVLVNVKDIPASMGKSEILDLKIKNSLVEASGFDLLVMGRPEGPGCYCFANNLIREIIEKLANSYPYIIIDNEAGLEHLSRRTTQKVDVLFMVSDPIQRGVLTVKRVAELADEMKLKVAKKQLIINRVNGGIAPELAAYVKSLDMEIAALIPEDAAIRDLDIKGRPSYEVGPESVAFAAVDKLIASLLP